MYNCLHDTFLELKTVKNGYCGNWGFIFPWDLGVIFLGIPIFKILRFRKIKFFKIRNLRCHRKMCGLFPCIPIFFFFRLKSVKKWACVIMLKIALLHVKSVFFGLNDGISKKAAQVAPKHTAQVNQFE